MIDLAQRDLFESLIEIDMNGTIIDLHNDFVCEKFIYHESSHVFELVFKGADKLIVRFSGVEIRKMYVPLMSSPDSTTLNNFYRGRFEVNGKLCEYTDEGKGYYYFEFEDGALFELQARNVFLSYADGDK